MDNGVDCQQDICGIIDDSRGVACTNAYGRFSAGVCGLYHTGTAGCKNEVNLLHDEVGHIEVGNVNPAYNAFGCARLYRRFVNYLRRGNSAVFARGCGLIIQPLRVLRQINVLKIAVEVGFVVGITAPITPMGSTNFLIP